MSPSRPFPDEYVRSGPIAAKPLGGPRGRPVLTAEESQCLSARVLAILKQHRGAQSAVTGGDLARALGHHNDRQIRLVIQQLIADGHPIAASVCDPAGYYVIATREEAEAYMAVLRSRATRTFKRMADLGRAVERVFGVPYQPLLLPLDGIDTAQAMREADECERW